jgi:uncharacterized protein (DUF305 family)
MEQGENMSHKHGMSYSKLLLMLFISFLVMYIVMFLNMDRLSHYHTSLTRIYMSLLMVTPMAVVMLLMMGKMYQDKKKNTLLVVASSILFVVILVALRTQTPVGDLQYMKAMIPHHSSAILVSKHAKITDPEVKELSEQIIRSQEEEIAEMEAILQRLEE